MYLSDRWGGIFANRRGGAGGHFERRVNVTPLNESLYVTENSNDIDETKLNTLLEIYFGGDRCRNFDDFGHLAPKSISVYPPKYISGLYNLNVKSPEFQRKTPKYISA